MTTHRKHVVPYRRKREGKTNYKKRLELLKGRQNRLIVRRTNTQIIIQIAQYNPDGDKILLTTQSTELKKLGWNHSFKNTPAAYLAGLLTAKKAKEKKIQNAILDLGLQTPLKGNKLYATLKGAIDGGLKIPANQEIFPKEERIKGDHVAKYNDKHKTISADFDKLKKQIQG